jgi:hypothetical protein
MARASSSPGGRGSSATMARIWLALPRSTARLSLVSACPSEVTRRRSPRDEYQNTRSINGIPAVNPPRSSYWRLGGLGPSARRDLPSRFHVPGGVA